MNSLNQLGIITIIIITDFQTILHNFLEIV